MMWLMKWFSVMLVRVMKVFGSISSLKVYMLLGLCVCEGSVNGLVNIIGVWCGLVGGVEKLGVVSYLLWFLVY